jgi:hypothetical protein
MVGEESQPALEESQVSEPPPPPPRHQAPTHVMPKAPLQGEDQCLMRLFDRVCMCQCGPLHSCLVSEVACTYSFVGIPSVCSAAHATHGTA